jgi:hypothetical protein
MISISFTFGLFCLLGSSYKFLGNEFGWAFYLIAIGVLNFATAIAMFKDYLKRD